MDFVLTDAIWFWRNVLKLNLNTSHHIFKIIFVFEKIHRPARDPQWYKDFGRKTTGPSGGLSLFSREAFEREYFYARDLFVNAPLRGNAGTTLK